MENSSLPWRPGLLFGNPYAGGGVEKHQVSLNFLAKQALTDAPSWCCVARPETGSLTRGGGKCLIAVTGDGTQGTSTPPFPRFEVRTPHLRVRTFLGWSTPSGSPPGLKNRYSGPLGILSRRRTLPSRGVPGCCLATPTLDDAAGTIRPSVMLDRSDRMGAISAPPPCG